MQKLPLFGLLSLMVFLGGCFSSENNDTSISQSRSSGEIVITSGEIVITTGDTVMSGGIETGVIHTGKQESITTRPQQEVKDIVGTKIPKGEDIEKFLSNYLSEEGLTGKVIGKKLARKDIIAISMGDKSVNGRCADYMSTECINFIIKNNVIIWSNSKSFIDTKKNCEQRLKTIGSCVGYPGDGEVYRFTDKGVLFSFGGGEGVPCQGGGADRFTYVNFENMQSLYSVLSRQSKGSSPIPDDEMCESTKTKRTKTETLRFYASNDDWNDEKKALPITAKTTEEAFYKYYKLPQPKN